MRVLPALCATVVLLATPALAQDRTEPRRPDQVVLELLAEAWSETETATVHAGIEAAFTGKQTASVREQVLAALAKVAPEAKWHLTAFDQVKDAAGLERWRITAETRLGESQLGGIRDRADGASRPGLKVAINHIDFTPTLAERESTLSGLRQQIYRDVKAELERLKTVYPDRKFRLRSIDFVHDRPVYRAEFARQAAAPGVASAPASAPMNVAQKLVVRATVVLADGD